jgi:hypothetical protein
MHRWQSLISDLQASSLTDPGQSAFHHIADLPKATAMRRPRPRQVVLDTPRLQPILIVFAAIGAVPVQCLRLATRPPTRTVDWRDVVEQGQRLASVGAIGCGDADGQWGAVAIDNDMAFAAFFGPIRGIFAGEYPPKTARTDWLSTQALSQSISPSRPRWSSKACRSFFQTPRRCQYRRRRQQVTPEPQPISRGRSSQARPVLSTKTIPVRQARSSTGGRPRLPDRALCRGRSGWIVCQSSSGTSGPGMAAPPLSARANDHCKTLFLKWFLRRGPTIPVGRAHHGRRLPTGIVNTPSARWRTAAVAKSRRFQGWSLISAATGDW